MFCRLFVLMALLMAGPTHALQYRKLDLEHRVRKSDLVAVAEMLPDSDSCKADAYCTEFRISTLLKGKRPDRLMLVHGGGGITELEPDCCEHGVVYILFLRRLGHQTYESADGPYGVISVGRSERSGESPDGQDAATRAQREVEKKRRPE